ncbi:hypothetical protein SAMN06265795_10311 [Noviherbaspirillum humi]|uniref:Uncharacterized protein n=1 Tax=Noviherbaspirillum humi TaxID=1688639 RepID=A0A239EUL2_9BURK|nr:hypothetical protein [Noviherbaspirillum humi]SNS47968.1 hypothetical protein SAMN06265795_10311 [Noviherbaspirillum humi]
MRSLILTPFLLLALPAHPEDGARRPELTVIDPATREAIPLPSDTLIYNADAAAERGSAPARSGTTVFPRPSPYFYPSLGTPIQRPPQSPTPPLPR